MKRGEFRAWIKGKNTISMWKSFKNNLIMVDISNMGEEALEKICRDIEKKKIQVLVSYSSALVALSQYLKNGKRYQQMEGGDDLFHGGGFAGRHLRSS